MTFLAASELWLMAGAIAASVVSERLLPVPIAFAIGFRLLSLVRTRALSVRTPIDWLVGAMFILLPIPFWVTPMPSETLTQVLRLLSGIALFYSVANWATSAARLRALLAGAAIVSTLLTAWALVSVQPTQNRLFFIPSSVYSLFQLRTTDIVNPAVIANVLAVMLPPLLAVQLWRRQARLRLVTALAFISSGLVIVMLIILQQRGPLLALGTAVLTLSMLRANWGWRLMVPVIGVLGAGLLGAAFWLRHQVDLTVALTGAEGRLEIWSRAMMMLRDAPLTGIGMGVFPIVSERSYPLFHITPGQPHAHNLFLQIALDLGLPGLLVWLGMLATTTRCALQVYLHGRDRQDGLAMAIGAGMLGSQIALVVNGITDSAIWGMIRPAVVVWALWGVAVAAWHVLGLASQSSRAPRRQEEPEYATNVAHIGR